MRRQPLHVEQPPLGVAGGAEQLDETDERGLRGVGPGVEHRLGREQPADRDAVEAAGEPLGVPRLDRVRPAELVRAAVRVDDPRVDPARRVAGSCAAGDDGAERRVDAQLEAPRGALQRSRESERLQRHDRRAAPVRTSRCATRAASGRARAGRPRAACRARGRLRAPRGRPGGRRAAARGATTLGGGVGGRHPRVP